MKLSGDMMNVNVHIERLILDGIDLPFHERPVLQAAVEGELARLLGEGGLQPYLTAGGAVRVAPGGVFQMTEGSNPTRFGQQIARAVYGGIGR